MAKSHKVSPHCRIARLVQASILSKCHQFTVLMIVVSMARSASAATEVAPATAIPVEAAPPGSPLLGGGITSPITWEGIWLPCLPYSANR